MLFGAGEKKPPPARQVLYRVEPLYMTERFKLNAFTIVNEFRVGVSFVLHQVNCPGHPVNMAQSNEDCGKNLKRYFCSVLEKEYPKDCHRGIAGAVFGRR